MRNSKIKQKTTFKSNKLKKENSDSKGKDEALASMSVDQFLASGFDSDEGSDAELDAPWNDNSETSEVTEEVQESSEGEEEESSEGEQEEEKESSEGEQEEERESSEGEEEVEESSEGKLTLKYIYVDNDVLVMMLTECCLVHDI